MSTGYTIPPKDGTVRGSSTKDFICEGSRVKAKDETVKPFGADDELMEFHGVSHGW